MALDYTNLDAIDTFEVEMIIKESDGTIRTIGSGNTTDGEISRKVDRIEIRDGIGQKLRKVLKTKKEDKIKVKVDQFDLDVFALKNGVKIDKTTKKTIFMWKKVSVATQTATVTGATRILGVKTLSGERLDMVTGTPEVGQVKVATNVLTFEATFADTDVYVSYEGDTTGDNLTIVFDATTFAQAVELVCHTVLYGQSEIEADWYVHFYECLLNDDFTLNFAGGKVVEQDLEFDILTPKTLPDGTLNTSNHTGVMYVTERVEA